jgi:hypothetical protein
VLTDVNGDGAADLAVGMTYPKSAGLNGRVVLVLGTQTPQRLVSDIKADVVIRGPAAFGRTLIAADFDHDRRHNLVVGDPDAGSAYLIGGREQFAPRGLLSIYAPTLLVAAGRGTGAHGLALAVGDTPEIAFEIAPGRVRRSDQPSDLRLPGRLDAHLQCVVLLRTHLLAPAQRTG